MLFYSQPKRNEVMIMKFFSTLALVLYLPLYVIAKVTKRYM